jgi:hypothetical protein
MRPRLPELLTVRSAQYGPFILITSRWRKVVMAYQFLLHYSGIWDRVRASLSAKQKQTPKHGIGVMRNLGTC